MSVVAFQGELGAYSHLACQQLYPAEEVLACSTFVEALQAVETGKADMAMIPLENSTAGRVEEIYRQIPKTHLHIIAEHFQPVNHCLMAHKGATPEYVISHPQALAQCHDHLIERGLSPRAEFDTAGAAQILAQSGDLKGAAIASELAAELYDLEIIQSHFEDVSGNTTRFLILTKEANAPTYVDGQPYITSLIFKVRNIPAALYKALGGFATNGLNLIKIESYMDGKTLNSSRFHIDVACHVDDPAMKRAMEELDHFSHSVRWLGTYGAHPFRDIE